MSNTATANQDQANEAGLKITRARASDSLIYALLDLDPKIDEARQQYAETGREDYASTARALVMVRVWAITVLEERYPQAADALNERFLSADEAEDIDYTAELIAAIALLNA